MKITVDITGDNEGTESPWWFICDPTQNMRADLAVAAMSITGPFFSRKEAEDQLKATRYNYGKKAAVWCGSGYHSYQYKMACRKAEAELKLPGHWRAINGDNHGLNSQPGDVWVDAGPLCPKEVA